MHTYRATVSILMSILYDRPISSFDHPVCNDLQDYMRVWCEYVHPNKFRPVDILPLLSRLPKWLSWNREICHISKIQRKLFFNLLEEFQDRREKGHARKDCLMAEITDNQEELGFTTEELALVPIHSPLVCDC
jgi:hypothetical protein